MSNLEQYLSKVRVPSAHDRVFKDECTYTFDTPESEGGLFVDMYSFLGFSKDMVKFHFQKTKNPLYLNIIRKKVPKKPSDVAKEGEPPKKKPTILAIGVEGGFAADEDAEKYEYVNSYALYVQPTGELIPLPNEALPQKIRDSVKGIIEAEAASKKDDVATWVATEQLQVSKHAATLKQLDNGKKIPPTGWKCEKCDLTQNLWLNLTNGAILCGRKNFDGSGGNNHAIEHYQATGYPLAVKLGTITKDGKGDVYSYAEDDMVEDPHLKAHMAHWGINVGELEKTDKTLAEMNVELNENFDFNRILESGKDSAPCFGPGMTGIKNLGNTCYMASVMQVLMHSDAFKRRYNNPAAVEYRNVKDPTADLLTQLSKFANGIHSGRYSKPIQPESAEATAVPYQEGITPKMFKTLVGKGHREFSTNAQQDAYEFYQYLLESIERSEHAESQGKYDPTRAFKIRFEDRIECDQSHMVKYTSRVDNTLSLPIPLSTAELEQINDTQQKIAKKEKIDPSNRPRVALSRCIEAWATPELINDFFSNATGQRGTAHKTTRFATFPDVLTLHMRKFLLDGWVPKKLDVFLDAPDEIDLTHLRAKGGLQPGETALPEHPPASAVPAAAAAAAEPQYDKQLVAQLMEMGFPQNRAIKAAVKTKNAPLDVAMEWLISHMEDADIDAPLETPKATSSPADAGPPEESVAMLCSMGFSRAQALKALKATQNNVERATEWIFSHAEDMDVVEGAGGAAVAAAPAETLPDGPGKYKLVAFISHMGTSTLSGHYVCHILVDGKWVLFNDRKVSACSDPPKDMAYMYFYQRVK